MLPDQKVHWQTGSKWCVAVWNHVHSIKSTHCSRLSFAVFLFIYQQWTQTSYSCACSSPCWALSIPPLHSSQVCVCGCYCLLVQPVHVCRMGHWWYHNASGMSLLVHIVLRSSSACCKWKVDKVQINLDSLRNLIVCLALIAHNAQFLCIVWLFCVNLSW